MGNISKASPTHPCQNIREATHPHLQKNKTKNTATNNNTNTPGFLVYSILQLFVSLLIDLNVLRCNIISSVRFSVLKRVRKLSISNHKIKIQRRSCRRKENLTHLIGYSPKHRSSIPILFIYDTKCLLRRCIRSNWSDLRLQSLQPVFQ